MGVLKSGSLWGSIRCRSCWLSSRSESATTSPLKAASFCLASASRRSCRARCTKNVVTAPRPASAASPSGSVRVRNTRADSAFVRFCSALFFTQRSVAPTRSARPSSYCPSLARGTNTWLISSSRMVCGLRPLDTSSPQGAFMAICRSLMSSTIVTSRAGSNAAGRPLRSRPSADSCCHRSTRLSSSFVDASRSPPASPTTITR